MMLVPLDVMNSGSWKTFEIAPYIVTVSTPLLFK